MFPPYVSHTPRNKQKSKSGGQKRKQTGKKVSVMPFISAPKNVVLTRQIYVSQYITADGSGNLSTTFDLSALLVVASSWISTVALFQRASVQRVTVNLIPMYDFEGVTPAVVGTSVLYYDATNSAVASTFAAALERNSAVLSSNSQGILTFNTPVYNRLALTTPIQKDEFAVGGFLGYLNIIGSSFRNAAQAYRIFIAFTVHFSQVV